MNITLSRLKDDKQSTIGFLNINNVPYYFTLEDGHHDVKIPGKTRIPSGSYKLKLRNAGTMNQHYKDKYGTGFHKGMIWLQDVPNFEWVYIHTGNTNLDTEGCILIGTIADLANGNKSVGRSVAAYKEIYPIIRDAILNGDEVILEINDISKQTML